MKPTTGHVDDLPPRNEPVAPVPPRPKQRRAEPDTDQMAVDTLMTSVFTGIFLLVSTIIFGFVGGTLLQLGGNLGEERGAKIGLAVGLALAMLLIVVLLKRFADRIKARSKNLYRGMWIGTCVALSLIVVMAYIPQIVFPKYCPPGPACL